MVAVDYKYVYDDGSPDPTKSSANRAYVESNLPLVIIFTFEFLFKVIGMGFVGFNGSYLSDKWNFLDFAVVIIG